MQCVRAVHANIIAAVLLKLMDIRSEIDVYGGLVIVVVGNYIICFSCIHSGVTKGPSVRNAICPFFQSVWKSADFQIVLPMDTHGFLATACMSRERPRTSLRGLPGSHIDGLDGACVVNHPIGFARIFKMQW